MSRQFDPKTCISAGQLRRMGFTLPPSMTDRNWVVLADTPKAFQDAVAKMRVPTLNDAEISLLQATNAHSRTCS